MRKICSFWLSLALILTSVSLGAFPVTAADVVDLTSYVKVIQFETPVEFSDVNGDHVGLCVSFSNAGVNLIREFFEYSYQGSNPYQTPDYGYMTVVIDGIEHKVTQYANSGDWFRLNVDGAGLFAGTQYTVCLWVYNWNDALSAQTNDFKVVCNYQSAGLTDTRIPLCEDIETSALNRLFIDYVDAMDISLWGDGSPYNLIDGDVGVPTTSGADRDGYLQGSKLGGNVYDNQCEVYFFNSEKDLCVEYYTLYTGGDTAKWPMRNPLGWVLYGSNYGFYEEDEWVVVDTVMPDSEYSTGMEDVSATPYTYKVDHPGVYACYKFVFTTRSEQFQLNELEIYGSDAINMGADGMWLDTLMSATPFTHPVPK